MQQKYTLSLLAGTVLTVMTTSAWSADPVPSKDQTRTQTQEQVQTKTQLREEVIYGVKLMTPKERADYRKKMRTAKTAEERERIRAEHHTQMQIRAKERGVTIPDEPPANRGPGSGMGGGKGPGGGMGSGGSK